MAKLHVKKGDNVVVIAGKDKGKTGKILLVNPTDSTVVVEGVNFIVKHKKARSANDKGGVIKKEGKISSSNVQVIDPVTKKATRVYHKLVDGKMVRVSKDGNVLDTAYVAKKVSKKADKKEEKAVKEVEVKPAKKATAKTETATKTAKATKEVAKTTSAKTTSTRTKTVTKVRNQER